MGAAAAASLRDLTLAVYARAEEIARSSGVILADTKLEFGTDPTTGAITLGDEVLTPGLLAVLARRRVGARTRPAVVRQAVRARLADLAGVRVGPPLGHRRRPRCPPTSSPRTRDRYLEAFERLTGSALVL